MKEIFNPHMFAQRVAIAIAVTIGIVAALYGLYLVKEILLLFFVAFILASAIRPTVLKLNSNFGIPKPLAVLGLQLALFTVLAAFVSLVLPPLARESKQLVTAATKVIDVSNLPEIRWESLLNQNPDQLSQTFDSIQLFFSRFGQSITSILGLFNSVLTTVILTVTLFVLMYYFIVSYDHLARSFAWMLPGDSRKIKLERAKRMLENISFELGGWIRGRLIVMILIGIITYIGLTLLGIPYALPLAIAATFLEIVPNIGPILAAVPAVILALFVAGPIMALIVTAFYIILQQVESSLITPQVMKKAVDVHPLTTLFLVLVGLHLMGVKGGLLILPMYVALRSVIQDLFPHHGPLGDMGS